MKILFSILIFVIGYIIVTTNGEPIPNVFTHNSYKTSVRVYFKGSQDTHWVKEFYDSRLNKGRLDATVQDDTVTYFYDKETDQTMMFDGTTCTVMTDAEVRNNGPVYLDYDLDASDGSKMLGPLALFRQVTRKAQLMPNTSTNSVQIRGINTFVYQATLQLGEDTPQNVYYYLADYGWTRGRSGQDIPVRLIVADKNFTWDFDSPNYVFDFYLFETMDDSDYSSLTPLAEIGCLDRQPTKAVPKMDMKLFSYFIESDLGYILERRWTVIDLNYKLSRTWPDTSVFTQSSIYDFKNEKKFVFDKDSCQIKEIADEDKNIDYDKLFNQFVLDNTYYYIGTITQRGIACNAWETATFDTDSQKRYVKTVYIDSKTNLFVRSVIKSYNSTGISDSMSFNFFNIKQLRYGSRYFQIFNIKNCMKIKRYFNFIFKRPDPKKIKDTLFSYQIRRAMVYYILTNMSMSILRFSSSDTDFNSAGVTVSVALLEKLDNGLTLDEIEKNLIESVANGNISLTITNGGVNSTYIVDDMFTSSENEVYPQKNELYIMVVTWHRLTLATNTFDVNDAKSIGDCYRACDIESTMECQSFSHCFDENGYSCRISSIISLTTTNASDTSKYEYNQNCMTYAMRYLKFYDKMDGVIIGPKSKAKGTATADTAEDCARLCSSATDIKCLSFEYSVETRSCVLRELHALEVKTKDLIQSQEYALYTAKYLRMFTVSGFDLVKSKVFSKISTQTEVNFQGIENCAKECYGDARCNSFNYCPISATNGDAYCEFTSMTPYDVDAQTERKTQCRNWIKDKLASPRQVSNSGGVTSSQFYGLFFGMIFLGIAIGIAGYIGYNKYKSSRSSVNEPFRLIEKEND